MLRGIRRMIGLSREREVRIGNVIHGRHGIDGHVCRVYHGCGRPRNKRVVGGRVLSQKGKREKVISTRRSEDKTGEVEASRLLFYCLALHLMVLVDMPPPDPLIRCRRK